MKGTVGRKIEVAVTLSGLARLLDGDLAGVVELARIADGAGVHEMALPDHLVMGPRTDRYPYGRFPLPADEPWLEPLTTLAAMASATSRLRLATNVLLAALRPAPLLAKSLATLDVLSRGRMDAGVGLGWQREEVEAAGVPFRERAQRLFDGLRACRALWSGEPAAFVSGTVRFADLRALPRPVQEGGVPFWLGARLTERNLAALVELCAGWMPVSGTPSEIAAGVTRLRAACTATGRDPATLGVRAHVVPRRRAAGGVDLEASLADVAALRDAGATRVAFPLAAFVRQRGEVRPFLERLGRLGDPL